MISIIAQRFWGTWGAQFSELTHLAEGNRQYQAMHSPFVVGCHHKRESAWGKTNLGELCLLTFWCTTKYMAVLCGCVWKSMVWVSAKMSIILSWKTMINLFQTIETLGVLAIFKPSPSNGFNVGCRGAGFNGNRQLSIAQRGLIAQISSHETRLALLPK